jgi:hypothetical protein
MGRNAAKELTRITAAIGTYLDRAEKDQTLALTYSAIEQATGVSRGHLSRRAEPEIIALVQRIALLKGVRRDGSAASAAEASHGAPLARSAPGSAARTAALTMAGELANVPIDTLGQQVTRDMREVARLQQQWISRHARSTAHDAPLALHDADELLRRLRAATERLRPLVSEWTRRHVGMNDENVTDGAPAFDLKTDSGN